MKQGFKHVSDCRISYGKSVTLQPRPFEPVKHFFSMEATFEEGNFEEARKELINTVEDTISVLERHTINIKKIDQVVSKAQDGKTIKSAGYIKKNVK